MRRLWIIPPVIVLSLFCLCEARSFAQTQDRPSSNSSQSANQKQGFFDYVLGKVNPQGNDYGASMQTGREAVVEHTIDDLYFWSNVVTLLLLTGTAAIVLLQWRSSDKKEVIAASLIAELWNGRISDGIELERRTEQFNQLAARHNAEVERTLSLKPSPSEQEREAAGNLSRSVRKLTEGGATSGRRDIPSGGPSTEVAIAGAPDTGTANSQQSTLLLQRQLEAMQNTEQNLKQRLNQTTLLLDQERRRNASLKGA